MKSHFNFSKQKRSGIFLLILLIVIAQCIYFFVDFSSEEIDRPTQKALEIYYKSVAIYESQFVILKTKISCVKPALNIARFYKLLRTNKLHLFKKFESNWKF